MPLQRRRDARGAPTQRVNIFVNTSDCHVLRSLDVAENTDSGAQDIFYAAQNVVFAVESTVCAVQEQCFQARAARDCLWCQFLHPTMAPPVALEQFFRGHSASGVAQERLFRGHSSCGAAPGGPTGAGTIDSSVREAPNGCEAPTSLQTP